MRDNQAQEEQKEATNKPAPPSTGANSSSRKRLLADPKPKSGAATASSDSSLSSYSESDQFRKKTRESPNLSDCHCCGLRINNTNPKERLQTLGSNWRIVLLCKKCIKSVELAEICPYCFAETLADCFRCRDCKRCIHKDCVLNYGKFAPWSYCCSELGCSVCVDCWVPKLLVNSIRVQSRGRNRNKTDSRVSVNSNGPKLLEDVVKDAKCAVEKKIAVAAKAKEIALSKAVVAKSAVELANGALDLVAMKDEDGVKREFWGTSGSGTGDTVVDDAELAFQLHRAMNSSPRISKNLCSINSSRNLQFRPSDSRGVINTSVCSKSKEKIDRTVLEPAVCIDLGNLNPGAMADVRTNENENRTQHLLKCYGNNTVLPDGRCNEKPDRYLLKYRKHPKENRTQRLVKCGGINTMMPYGKGNEKPDRYLLKYRKRSMSSKTVSNSETEASL